MNKNLFYLLILTPFFFNSCNKEPQACFSYEPSIIYINDTVKFINCSENADRYTWQFGDDSASTEINPIHVYKDIVTIPTVYTVILVAETSSASDITSMEITIHHPGEIFQGSYSGVRNIFEKNFLISSDTIIISSELSPADKLLYWKGLCDEKAYGEVLSKKQFNIRFSIEQMPFSGYGVLSDDSLHIKTFSEKDSIFKITFDGIRL